MLMKKLVKIITDLIMIMNVDNYADENNGCNIQDASSCEVAIYEN